MSYPGEGSPQKPLLPGPGTQAWPGAPSQLEAGRDCISPGEGMEGPAWPQVTGTGGLCDPHPPQEPLWPLGPPCLGPACDVPVSHLSPTFTGIPAASLISVRRNVGRGAGCKCTALIPGMSPTLQHPARLQVLKPGACLLAWHQAGGPGGGWAPWDLFPAPYSCLPDTHLLSSPRCRRLCHLLLLLPRPL